jgi:hypothetical protein
MPSFGFWWMNLNLILLASWYTKLNTATYTYTEEFSFIFGHQIFSNFYVLLLYSLGVYCEIYKTSYNKSNISYLNSLFPLFSLILFSPHSWNSINSYHFSIYIHVYTVFALYAPSHTLSSPPPPSHSHCYPPPHKGPVSPSCSVILQKKKKWTFSLFMIAIQGVSLWHFHGCMYYNLNWFISCIFLLSILVPFLWWFEQF